MPEHNPKIIRAWCLYDWANSAFATTVMAAVLPIFFRNVAAAQSPIATSLWGYTSSLSMLLVAVISLVLGPFSDYSATKKHFLKLFMIIGSLSTALLALTGSGDWIWVCLLFLLGNVGYAGSEIFYDSLLPHIAPPGQIDRISTRAYAYGYLGGGILLAINLAMIWMVPGRVITPGSEPFPVLGMQLSFLTVGIWWFAFTRPLLRHVPEPPGQQSNGGRRSPLSVSIERLSRTFREIKKYRQLFLFILAFWCYNDGIGTIIKMATAFGDEIGISTLDLVGALMMTQIIAVPCSLLFGRMAGKIGAKRSILIGVAIYLALTVSAFFMTTALHFWILAGIVGTAQGGTQALSRSLFGSMVPIDKSAEFFSFYNISGKFAGIVGPAVFALVAQLTGASRLGILSLVVFFIAGGILLMKVDVEEGRRVVA